MTSVRTLIIAALAVLLAAPHTAAQQALRVAVSGQTPAFSFTKDITPPAPIPRLDLRGIVKAQDPDPTGRIAKSVEAGESELRTDSTFTAMGGTFLAVGSGFLLVGAVKGLDHGPQPYVGKTRGGAAAGVRIPIGLR